MVNDFTPALNHVSDQKASWPTSPRVARCTLLSCAISRRASRWSGDEMPTPLPCPQCFAQRCRGGAATFCGQELRHSGSPIEERSLRLAVSPPPVEERSFRQGASGVPVEERPFRVPLSPPTIEKRSFRSRVSCGTIGERSFRSGAYFLAKRLGFPCLGACGGMKMNSRLVSGDGGRQDRGHVRDDPVCCGNGRNSAELRQASARSSGELSCATAGAACGRGVLCAGTSGQAATEKLRGIIESLGE